MVSLNSSHLFLADGTRSGQTFLLDWEEGTWAQVDSMALARLMPACGVVNTEEGGLVSLNVFLKKYIFAIFCRHCIF